MIRHFRHPLPLLCAALLLGCPSPEEVTTEEPEASVPDAPPPRDAGKEAMVPETGPVDPDFANAPEILSIDPKTAYVGTTGPSIIVTGKNFVERTVVQLEGAVLTTSYVSPTELRATLPTSRLTTTGQLRVSAGTSPPGGGVSSIAMFDVINPPPSLTSITSPSPSSVPMGNAAFSLTVAGANFVSGAKIIFDAADLVTTFNSATSLSAMVPATKLTKAGTFNVVVKNPAPGGGVSTPIAFVVTNPTVQVTSLSPNIADVATGPLALSVMGSGFIPASAVSFNGTPLATVSYVSATQLNATIPAAALSSVGLFPVVVTNPAPGGGVSSPQMFQVRYPAPTAASLAPSTATAGAAPTAVTITGTGFFPASEVTFNGAPSATTYISSTQVRATLTATQLSAPGTIAVRVVSPMPGGGTSNALSFQVSNPAPLLATVLPSRPLYVAGADVLLTLNGSGFVGTSQVRANGSVLLTNYVSGTQLTATLPASALSSPDTISFTVFNPSPGGGTSNAIQLNVACDPTGVEVQLSALGTPVPLMTNFKAGGAPKQERFPNAGACPMAVSTSLQPFRAVVVQNNMRSQATLAAWAVCSVVRNAQGVAIAADDAFLTFYRGSSIPVTNFEREPCTPVVAEGYNAAGAYDSPESGGAGYCPGMTKANGAGIKLNACEKAVVFMQPYDVASTQFTPPTTMKVSLE